MYFFLILSMLAVPVSFSVEKEKGKDTTAKRREYKIPYSYAEGACTSEEIWNLTEKYDDEFYSRFNSNLTNPKWSAPVIAESSRLMTSKSNLVEAKFLGKYWLARHFYSNKLYHIAHSLFLSVIDDAAKQKPAPVGVAWSSVQCILEMSKQYPTLTLPGDFSPEYMQSAYKSAPKNLKHIYWDAALKLSQLSINDLADQKFLNQLLNMAKDSPSHTSLIRANAALMKEDFEPATKAFEEFLALPKEAQLLSNEKDMVRLLLGRAYYTMKQYPEAIKHFQEISKTSNLLIQALTDSSWSYLMTKNYADAMGTSLTLQSPALKNAYSPESLMVLGIAYFELCRYPESLQALRAFKRRYNPAYKYLRTWWEKAPEKRTSPYTLLIQFLKDQNTYPTRIGTELLRSPVFQSKQSELNLIKRFSRMRPTLMRVTIPQSKVAQVNFRSVIQAFNKTVKYREKRILEVINQDLELRLKYLLWHLNQAGDNGEFLEAEILRKAGDDIVWQNLNPEYKDYLTKLKAEDSKQRKFWNWGETSILSDENSELWEDELGNIRAEVTNICKAKDDVTEIKKKQQ